MLLRRGEAHDVFDARPVVPAAVEDDDFASRREVLHVPLHVHLCLFAIGRRRQRDDPEDAGADPFGDRANRAALACAVAPFEDDDDAQPFLLDPALKVAQADLQFLQLFFVLRPFHGCLHKPRTRAGFNTRWLEQTAGA